MKKILIRILTVLAPYAVAAYVCYYFYRFTLKPSFPLRPSVLINPPSLCGAVNYSHELIPMGIFGLLLGFLFFLSEAKQYKSISLHRQTHKRSIWLLISPFASARSTLHFVGYLAILAGLASWLAVSHGAICGPKFGAAIIGSGLGMILSAKAYDLIIRKQSGEG